VAGPAVVLVGLTGHWKQGTAELVFANGGPVKVIEYHWEHGDDRTLNYEVGHTRTAEPQAGPASALSGPVNQAVVAV